MATTKEDVRPHLEHKTFEFTGEQINMLNEALLWYINSAEFGHDVHKEVLVTLPKYKDLWKYLNSL